MKSEGVFLLLGDLHESDISSCICIKRALKVAAKEQLLEQRCSVWAPERAGGGRPSRLQSGLQ